MKKAIGRQKVQPQPSGHRPTWKYEPDEKPKRKHHWNKPFHGFVEVAGSVIGKCPNNVTNEEAEKLLNAGIPWSPPRWTETWPKRIYIIRDGVVYRATPTNPGVSYHAFPEFAEELRTLPRALQQVILTAAKAQGCEEQVKRWMKP